MCSISGVILLDSPRRHKETLLEIEEKVKDIVCASEERGRDSWGVVSLGPKGEVASMKGLGKASAGDWKTGYLTNSTVCVLANCRAEPTTEYVQHKNETDIQPFSDSKETVWVAHNGTIANDATLREEVHIEKPKSKIDTQALVEYLASCEKPNIETLKHTFMCDVVGSFAIGMYDVRKPKNVTLIANYKPLYTLFSPEHRCVYFSSFPEYLDPLLDDPMALRILQVGPYEIQTFSTDGSFQRQSLYEEKASDQERVAVICSGGLDSTVVATKYVREGKDVTLVHFTYKCRAESKEVQAIKEIAARLNCKTLFVDVGDLFKEVIGHSRLTGTGESLVTERGGEASAELAWEWVPARNLIFYSLTTGIAEAHGFDIIALGNNLEESSAYPDNEAIFTRQFASCLPYAVNLGNRVRVEMPVGNLMKHEIVKLGLELNAPLDLAWSCYENHEKPCNQCGPCYMRRVAFKMCGVKDPYEYEIPTEEGFWDDCVAYSSVVRRA
jgi:7-cyano-7-deazaguanine synthase